MKIVSYIVLFTLCLFSCSDEAINPDSEPQEDPIKVEDPVSSNENTCTATQKVYEGKNGIFTIDFETVPKKNGWKKSTDVSGYLGNGYLYWDGQTYYNTPGKNKLTFRLKVIKPGTYRVLWRSRILKGSDATEHNDSWLRFPDADNFYGLKDGNKVYPVGSGKTPNPQGASKDGWFKVYMNGAGEWKWQSKTSDHDPYNVYATFDKAGIYKMEVSARSAFHGIDRVVLFDGTHTVSQATKNSNSRSPFNCP